MRNETSYGVVPLKKHKASWQVLLVQHYSGYWTFPKGHKEGDETGLEAAERELFEETGLKIKAWLTENSYPETYFFRLKGDLIHKTAYYYPAIVVGKVKIQQEEVHDTLWIALSDSITKLTYKPTQEVAHQVILFLNTKFKLS